MSDAFDISGNNNHSNNHKKAGLREEREGVGRQTQRQTVSDRDRGTEGRVGCGGSGGVGWGGGEGQSECDISCEYK